MSSTIAKRTHQTSRHVCRTCMVTLKHRHMTPIFTDIAFDNKVYSEIISFVAGVEISEDDGLTAFICGVCKQNAKVAYQYKLQARKADRALRNFVPFSDLGTDGKSESEDASTVKIESDIKHKKNDDTSKKFKKELTIKRIKEDADKTGNNGNISVKVEISRYDVHVNKYDNDGFDDRSSPLDDGYDFFDDLVKEEPKISQVLLPTQACDICGAVFESPSALQHHLMFCVKSERVEERSNYCPVCGASFDNALALLQHARTHIRLLSGGGGRANKLAAAKHATNAHNWKKKNLKAARDTLWKNELDEERRAGVEVEHVQDVPDHPRCGICSSVFDTRERLDNHFVIHSGTSVTWCALCDKLFLEPVYLRRHLRTAHRQEEVACSDKMAAAVRTTLLGDLVTQRRETSADSLYLFVCPHCGQLTLSENDLISHNSTEHPDFCHRCPRCFKLFRDATKVLNHRRLCIPSDRFDCLICKKKFAHEMILTNHMQTKHQPKSEKQKEHTCYICGKQFNKLDALDKHKFRSHSKKNENGQKTYECDTCHLTVTHKGNLGTHMHIHDPKYKPPPPLHLCRFCGVRLTQASNLRVHIRRHHTGERPFQCKFCNKAFVRTTDKNVHERSHTGVKPYTCQVCGMRSSKSWLLRQHMRVHTGERPYKCSVCGRGFSQKHDMKKHERRHTGERAHGCDACGDSFTQAKELREHKAACVRVATSPVSANDPHLVMIKGQMEFARSFSWQS